MKRLTIALGALGLSSIIFAALLATSASGSVVISKPPFPDATDLPKLQLPKLPGRLMIGVTGYFLQLTPTHGDLDFASSGFGTNSPISLSFLKTVEQSYDWSWGANVGYIFPNTSNDVNLSFFHLNTDERNTVFPGSPAGGTQFITVDPITAVAVTDYLATLKTEYDLNRVDLTAGQFVDVGRRLTLHPSIGLSYLKLERELNSSYQGTVTGLFEGAIDQTLSDSTIIHEKSDFDGVGPLANLDASYYIGDGFGLVGHADAGLYIGDIDAKTNAIRNEMGVTLDATPTPYTALIINSLSAGSKLHMVPVTEIKLGAEYTFLFNNAANSDLTLEAGYQLSHYFNAVERLNSTLSGAFVFITGNFFEIGSPTINGRTTSDVNLNGPYVSLILHI